MLTLNKFSDVPVYEQLIHGIEREILGGLLREETQIPSIRELSARLGVNPNTIQRAYLELARREEIVASPGNGYYVAAGAVERVRKREAGKLKDLYALVQQLAVAGIPESEIQDTIRAAYRECAAPKEHQGEKEGKNT